MVVMEPSFQSFQLSVPGYQFHGLKAGSAWDSKTNRVSASPLPVLFLHGFMGSSDDWREVMACLGDRHPCLAIDLPGHGQTQVTGGDHLYRMPEAAVAIIQLLDRLQILTCALVGYSMGGRLALYLALHYPDRFQSLILESASPGLQTVVERQTRREQDEQRAKRLESSDFLKFLQRWYKHPLFGELRQNPCFSVLMERRLRNDPNQLARSLRNMGTGQQPSLWEHLHHLRMPTLLLVGERDAKFWAIANEMQEHILAHPEEKESDRPPVQIRVIPNSSHNTHAECPEAFIAELSGFLDNFTVH